MTSRAAPTSDFITQGSLHPSELTKLVADHFVEYIGALPIALAVVAFFSSRHRSSTRAFGLFTVITTVLCLGKYTPLYRALFAWVPGFSKFRIPLRFHVLLSRFPARVNAGGSEIPMAFPGREADASPCS